VEEKKVEMARFRPLLVACHHRFQNKSTFVYDLSALRHKIEKKDPRSHIQRTFFATYLSKKIKILFPTYQVNLKVG
jgi:hypothetical protein